MLNTLISTSVQSTSNAANYAPLAATVVTNDSAALMAKATVSMRKHFEDLSAEREVWEQTICRTSNEQLYALLQKCYMTYKAMAGDTAEAAALRSGLKDFVNATGLKFNASTHTIVKIVKCVFGNDRRRVSAYGIVLRAALTKDIAAADLPAFISREGGIEEIRLSKAPNAMTPKQKAALAAGIVQSENIGVVSSHALNNMLDAGNIGKSVVLIGTWQADGSVTVRSVVQNDSAVNAALACHYNVNKEAIRKKSEQMQAANDDQIKQNAISTAIQAAVINN